MKKIIRLTENDLTRIVKRVIMEQNSEHEFVTLTKKIQSKYRDLCKYDTLKDYGGGRKTVKLNTGGKQYQFDPDVKRYQELYNSLSKTKLKVDGIIGPETKTAICNVA